MTHDKPDFNEEAREAEAWAELGGTWRGASPDESQQKVADLLRRGLRFRRQVRLRNFTEWLFCALLAGLGVRNAVRCDSAVDSVPWFSLVVVAVWIGGVLYWRGRNAAPLPPTATTTEFLAYERAQLERQRALLARARVWYLAPFIAWIALLLGFIVVRTITRMHGPYSPTALLGVGAVFALVVGGIVVLFVFLDRLNSRALRGLDRRLSKTAIADVQR